MIYMSHNLISNYHSANGAGDDKMKADILTSEIAKLIAKHPDRVIEDLQAEGFAITLPITPDNLVNKVADALFTSKGFAKRLVDDILSGDYSFCCGDGDDKKEPTSDLSNDGLKPKDKKEPKDKKPVDYGALMGSASDLINGLGNLFGGKKKAKADTEKAKAEAERAKYEAQKSLSEKTKALLASKKSNMGWYIGGGIAVAIAITTIVFIALKMKK